MRVSNHSIPTLRDTGQHQGTTDLERDEVSVTKFMVPQLPILDMETIQGFLCPDPALATGQAAELLISNSLMSKMETLFLLAFIHGIYLQPLVSLA